jgi:hypothetical protein
MQDALVPVISFTCSSQHPIFSCYQNFGLAFTVMGNKNCKPVSLQSNFCLVAGGQNVNKLNTKAEVRFHVLNAEWMPDEVKQRLYEQQANRINNMGELLVTSQEHR